MYLFNNLGFHLRINDVKYSKQTSGKSFRSIVFKMYPISESRFFIRLHMASSTLGLECLMLEIIALLEASI